MGGTSKLRKVWKLTVDISIKFMDYEGCTSLHGIRLGWLMVSPWLPITN